MEKTNKKIEKNNLSVQDPSDTVKKRGRPKGSTNKTIRKDHDINAMTEPGDNAKIIRYSLSLSQLPKIDINNLQSVQERITQFFTISEQYDIKPAIASLALSFGCNRMTFFNWVTGRHEIIKNKECLYAIKNAYDIINSQYELLMNTGKINPVAGIFLMKNNFGYKDNTEFTITANQEKQDNITDIANRAGLLSE